MLFGRKSLFEKLDKVLFSSLQQRWHILFFHQNWKLFTQPFFLLLPSPKTFRLSPPRFFWEKNNRPGIKFNGRRQLSSAGQRFEPLTPNYSSACQYSLYWPACTSGFLDQTIRVLLCSLVSAYGSCLGSNWGGWWREIICPSHPTAPGLNLDYFFLLPYLALTQVCR